MRRFLPAAAAAILLGLIAGCHCFDSPGYQGPPTRPDGTPVTVPHWATNTAVKAEN